MDAYEYNIDLSSSLDPSRVVFYQIDICFVLCLKNEFVVEKQVYICSVYGVLVSCLVYNRVTH